MRHFWLFITIWFGLASALNAQGHCSAPSVSLTFSPAMLNFDNKGQSFVSAHHGENITSLTEITRKLTACTTRNSTPTLRRLALFAQVLTSFRLQYANAYVLHEYAHAEMGHRFGTSGIMIGRSPNNNGLGPTQNDAYLQNLLRMAFGECIRLTLLIGVSASIALALPQRPLVAPKHRRWGTRQASISIAFWRNRILRL